MWHDQKEILKLQAALLVSPARKAETNPFFGKKHTEEARRKMSLAATGRVLTEEHKRKIGEASKRRAMTEASRRRLAEYLARFF